MRREQTIEDMCRVAETSGGKCLSDIYVNGKTKLRWQCKKGHQWAAIPNNIKRGHWCPYCAGTTKLTIDKMRAIANERGGKCLSGTYVNSKTKLLWECSEGHQWWAVPNAVKHRTWCPYCAKTFKLTIEEMNRLAGAHGGKCLSNIYANSDTKLLWECAQGHTWRTTPKSVKHGSWCPRCAKTFKGTIEQMRRLASDRGGQCLSQVYVNDRAKLLWECAHGHSWWSTPEKIKIGRWCPECSSGIAERICRAYFEQLFGKKFPKVWPKWLTNARGNRMELDGYCRSLAIAFEHQGEQHFSTRTHYIRTKDGLRSRKEDDRFKKELCEQRSIILIEIPELQTRLHLDELKSFIKEECVRRCIPLPLRFDSIEINLKKAYASSGAVEEMKLLRALARKRGGECLSKAFIGWRAKLRWQCKKGHQWEANPNNIKKGRWCPHCSHRAKLTIGQMRQLAKKRGGKCLSEVYVNALTNLRWECSNGHQWDAVPASIKSRTWCPYCAGTTKLTIEEMRTIAKEHGGRCLSDTYVNGKTKLLWECSEGHQWWAVPNAVKHRTWCPYCAKTLKLTIGEMRQIAETRSGKCLSETYVNAFTKLKWQCEKGHQWKATLSNIKKGTWCPDCARDRKNSRLSSIIT